jgi:hypothetical protein
MKEKDDLILDEYAQRAFGMNYRECDSFERVEIFYVCVVRGLIKPERKKR